MKKSMSAVRNKNEQRKSRNRRLAGALAILLVAVMLLGFIAPFFVQGASIDSQPVIEITGELGFLRKYKVGGSTPVRIFLENKGSNFKGELQLKIANSIGMPPYTRNTVYAYPLELLPGDVKSVYMTIEIPVIETELTLTLVDENGFKAATETLDAIAIEPSDILIGALTDDRNSLNYFRQMPLNVISRGQQSIVDEKLVFFDENSMPDDVSVLDNLNFIIINNFDTGRLSKKQLYALKEWVETGGVLLLGAGPNYSKVYKELEEIVQVESIGKTQISTFERYLESINADFDFSVPTVLERMEVENGIELMKENGETLITAVNSSKGVIIVHNFDLGIEPIPDINRKTGFLDQIYLSYASQAINNKLNLSMYDFMMYFNSNIELSDMSRITAIFALVGLYCLVIGPILYFILKRKDMREKAIVIIPAVSLITVLVIGLICLGSPFKQPITSTNALITIESGKETGIIESVTRAYSPQKGEFDIEFDRNVTIKPLEERYYNYSSVNQNEFDEKKIILGEKTGLSYTSKGKWDSNRFRNKNEILIEGGIICELGLDGGNLVGVIKNMTDMDFYDVLVGVAGGYEKYEYLGAYSQLEINQALPETSFSVYGGYGPAQAYRSLNSAVYDISASESRIRRQRETMLDYFVSNRSEIAMKYGYSYNTAYPGVVYTNSTVSVNSAVALGFGGTGLKSVKNIFDVSVFCFNNDVLNDFNLTINGHEPSSFNSNLFEIKASIDFKPGSLVRIPSWMIRTEVETIDANIDIYDSTSVFVLSGGDLIFSYTVPDNIKLSEFWIDWDLTNNPLAINNTSLLYNNKTGQWDEISFTKIEARFMRFASNNYSAYVDEDMQIRMKAAVDANLNIFLPGFGIEGTVTK